MKYKFILLLTFILPGFSSCDKSTEIDKIPFERYTFPDDVVLNLNMAEPVIVNDNNTLNSLIVSGDCPSIDFTDKTLILCSGKTGNVIRGYDVELLRHNEKDLTLKLDIDYGDIVFPALDSWEISIICDKMAEDAKIRLSVLP